MRPGPVSDLEALLAGMDPRLDSSAWCFEALTESAIIHDAAFAVIREDEGACAILPAELANGDAPRFARITLYVLSDLEAVGLTGMVSSALANAGIACNMVAGLRHDHLFVPAHSGKKALEVLRKVSRDARK